MTMVIVVLSGATRILCTESQVSVLWNYINKYKVSYTNNRFISVSNVRVDFKFVAREHGGLQSDASTT